MIELSIISSLITLAICLKRAGYIKEHYETKWFDFYPSFSGFSIKVNSRGYDADNMELVIYFFLFKLFLTMPVKSISYEYEDKTWGFYYDSLSSAIVICMGYKSKFISMPWAYVWFRTSILMKDGTWEHEIKRKKGKYISKDFWDEKWKELRFQEKHPYNYVLKNGNIQHRVATISIREMEWRRYGWVWSKAFRLVRKTIEVEFDDEVGERTGSCKGGTVGCDYQMKCGETPYQTLKRMELQKKFN
jgi:hypothetical protein